MNQFYWMNKELTQARLYKQKVWILGHIVPGATTSFTATWHKRYVRSFVDILGNFTDIIEMNFFSHLHRDSFRLVYDSDSNLVSSMMLTSSFTPKEDNNPSFRYLSYNTTSLEINDYCDYYTDLSLASISSPPQWNKEYCFNSAYDMSKLDYGNLYTALKAGKHNIYDTWYGYYGQLSSEMSNKYTEQDYLCSFPNLDEDTLGSCMGTKIAHETVERL